MSIETEAYNRGWIDGHLDGIKRCLDCLDKAKELSPKQKFGVNPPDKIILLEKMIKTLMEEAK